MTHPSHSDLEVITKLWPAFTGIIIVVVWLVRLEARSLSNRDRIQRLELDVKESATQKDFDDHRESMKDNLKTIYSQNNKILQSVARIEGKLEHKKGVTNENVI